MSVRPLSAKTPPGKLNVLMILVDEERRWEDLPPQFPFAKECPGRARLRAQSIEFPNFRTSTSPCGPARATLYTGRHFQEHGMWSNKSGELQPDMPTIGNYMAKEGGYYCVYKGKWHLHEDFTARLDTLWPETAEAILQRHKGVMPPRWDALEPWGFHEWNEKGDHWGVCQEGWEKDGEFAEQAVDWLRNRRPKDKPWFMAFNLINPHDIMFFMASDEQRASRDPSFKMPPGRPLLGPPDDPMYKAKWHCQPLVPPAEGDVFPGVSQRENAKANRQFGHMGAKEIEIFVDYYLNCIRDSDRHIVRVLDTLTELGLDDSTVVIFTSDHGEMAGDFGSRQKGPFLQRGNVSVPFLMRIPGVKPGQCNSALCTTDVPPTILSLAGVQDWRTRCPGLVGEDALACIRGKDARECKEDADLDGATIFQYAQVGNTGKGKGKKGKGKGKKGPPPRNFMQGLLTKRWKYSRCFAPEDQPFPTSWEVLEEYNDLILYDTVKDPFERVNLVEDKAGMLRHKELLLKLNQRLQEMLAKEVPASKKGPFGFIKDAKDLPPDHHSISGPHAKGKGKGEESRQGLSCISGLCNRDCSVQ